MQDVKEPEEPRKHDIRKEHSSFPVTNPKDMEICDLSDKEFKVVILGSSVNYRKA